MSSVPSTAQTLSGPASKHTPFGAWPAPPREALSIEKTKLMGRAGSPHLHLDLTGQARVIFKVTADFTSVLFSKNTLEGQISVIL